MTMKHYGPTLLVAALAVVTSTVVLADWGRPDFSSLDSNGDGVVSLSEFEAGAPKPPTPAEIFSRIDSDGDGSLTEAEFEGEGRGGRGHRGPGFMDEDDDGLISQEEFVNNAPPRARNPASLFERIDANADGYLDPEELASAHPRR